MKNWYAPWEGLPLLGGILFLHGFIPFWEGAEDILVLAEESFLQGFWTVFVVGIVSGIPVEVEGFDVFPGHLLLPGDVGGCFAELVAADNFIFEV